MFKFLKRLFLSILFFLFCLGTWGFYNDLRFNNYQQFIYELVDFIQKDEPKLVVRTSPKPPKKENRKPKIPLYYGTKAFSENNLSEIDKHVLKCPTSQEENVDSLAVYLQKRAKTDLEKARAIYVWLAHNISYDDSAFNSRDYLTKDYCADSVLRTRSAVCEGFSNLYVALGEKMGLEIKKVIGYAKGYSHVAGRRMEQPDHAWNIIKVNDSWRIFDATWGQGNGTNVNGKLVSKHEFDDYWFNVNPYEAIFSHLPEDENNSFVEPPLSLKIYEQMPNIDEEYFELGFSGKETYKNVISNIKYRIPDCYIIETPVKLGEAPKLKYLKKDQSYYFEFYVPKGIKMAAIDVNNDWFYFEKNKDKFSLEYIPKNNGILQISVQYQGSGKAFSTFLIYEVFEEEVL